MITEEVSENIEKAFVRAIETLQEMILRELKFQKDVLEINGKNTEMILKDSQKHLELYNKRLSEYKNYITPLKNF